MWDFGVVLVLVLVLVGFRCSIPSLSSVGVRSLRGEDCRVMTAEDGRIRSTVTLAVFVPIFFWYDSSTHSFPYFTLTLNGATGPLCLQNQLADGVMTVMDELTVRSSRKKRK